MKTIKVNLNRRYNLSYDVFVDNNMFDRIGLLIAKRNVARRYIVISDSNVSSLYGEAFLEMLRKAGLPADFIEFPAGEASKNLDTVSSIVKQLIEKGADRSSALIALGGGVTGDIVGFVSSIYMRSIPCIQVPTSLMAQVDSSIGGKTGIDLSEGKNLLGTFSQPKMVLTNLAFLETLPDEEFNNGLAEIIKYGIIDDVELFQLLEEEGEAVRNRDAAFLETIVGKSCKIKGGIVEIDEGDKGIRRILNFGHTLGHAIEAASGYTISHGNAVSVGMIAATRISERKKHLSTGERDMIEKLIKDMKLLSTIPQSVGTADILSKMKMDKKKEGSTIHFVFLKKLGVPFINGSVEEGLIRETIEDLR